jgi:hypothetical protein
MIVCLGRAMEPGDHGLKPVELEAKINPFSLRLFLSGIFVTTTQM